MKERLRTLYDAQKIGTPELLNAIAQGWITAKDAKEIVGEEKALDFVKACKLDEISRACHTTITKGFDVPDLDNAHFNLSTEDQSNIANLFKVVELGGTEYPYQADGGVCKVYSAEDITKIYFAAQTLITTQTTYHNALKAYVQTLQDVDSIEAITYGQELPPEIKAQIEEKLKVAQQQLEKIIANILRRQ